MFTLNSSTHKKSEVDLRVAQELKNNQDFIYQTNQSLQDLKKGLDAVVLQHQKLLDKSGSDNKDVEIRLENFEEEVVKSINHCLSKVNNITDYVNVLCKSIDVNYKKISEQIYLISERLANQEEQLSICTEIEKSIENLSNRLDQDIFSVKSLIQHHTSSLRDDLCKQIPKIDLTKEQLEECLKTVYVDFAGLVREIELLKKSTNYSEKKFENIYTLINRSKEGK